MKISVNGTFHAKIYDLEGNIIKDESIENEIVQKMATGEYKYSILSKKIWRYVGVGHYREDLYTFTMDEFETINGEIEIMSDDETEWMRGY